MSSSNGSENAADDDELVPQHGGGRPAPAQLRGAEHVVQVFAGEPGNDQRS
jgi:hypothetical protein